MGLSQFIIANLESILVECEDFARSIPAAAGMDKAALRDHSKEILTAIAADMRQPQSAHERSEKSKGHSPRDVTSPTRPTETHGELREEIGFSFDQTLSEFRALRASVVRLWLKTAPTLGSEEIDELTRFNEGMDQALAESLSSYAQAAARSRNLFLGVLSHELRTPLATIVTSAHSLQKAAEMQRTLPGALDRVLRGSKRIESILADLLDYVRSGEGGGMRVTTKAITLADLCERVAREVEAAFPGSRIEVSTSGEMKGEWDEQRLAQALSNLLSNGIKYGSPGGTVRLQVDESAEAGVAIKVCNEGPQIPDDVRQSLFQPLARGSGADRTGFSLGLGLYIVSEIAKSHGGTVTVDSAPGNTVFTICLPRSLPAEGSPASFDSLGSGWMAKT